MLKYFYLFSVTLYLSDAAVIRDFQPFEVRNFDLNFAHKPENLPKSLRPAPKGIDEIKSKWERHVTDFLELIDLEKVIGIVFLRIDDPDVMNFIAFLTNVQFKETLLKFQDIEEFKEAVQYLQSRGYDVKSVIDYINSFLALPVFGTDKLPHNSGTGLTTLIAEIIKVLPVEEMKKLFEEKLEKDPEVKELFEALSSEEFIDIISRLRQNPKFLEIKKVFQGYGLNLEQFRPVAENVFGDHLNRITKKLRA